MSSIEATPRIITTEAIPTASRHVFVDPETEQVHIQSIPYTFDKEEKTFDEFKSRYANYWTLFNVLLILTVL